MPDECEGHDVRDAEDLIEAIWNGNRAWAVELLDAGVSVHQTPGVLETPIMVAARNGQAEMIELLLDRGVDPNAPADYTKRRPLCTASELGRVEAVRLLIARGANVNAIDESGGTPLLAATLSLETERINAPNETLWRLRQEREWRGLAAVIEELLLAGADVDYPKDPSRYSARDFLKRINLPRLTNLVPAVDSSGSRRSFWSKLLR
jgi:ankyrin repeat protein